MAKKEAYNPKTYKKRTGCKLHVSENGNPCLSAFRITKRWGLISYFCTPFRPNGKTKVSVSKTGIEHETWTIEVKMESGQKTLYFGFYNTQTKKLTCKDLGLVMNPKAKNGGYCGTYNS